MVLGSNPRRPTKQTGGSGRTHPPETHSHEKRRAFFSLTTRTPAALTASPSLPDTTVGFGQSGNIAPRWVAVVGDFVIGADPFSEGYPDKLADLTADTATDALRGGRLGWPHGRVIRGPFI